MKKSKVVSVCLPALLCGTLYFFSCKKENKTMPVEILNQKPDLSKDFDYEAKHHVNNRLATLGRVLFYDKNLSINNSTSCGSCHKQEFAFADRVRFNTGFNGLLLNRNSPSIQGIRGFEDNTHSFSLGFGQTGFDASNNIPSAQNQVATRLFWDGRQTSVVDMVLNPVTNHKEMSMPDFETLVKKLGSIPYYPALFKKAFGDENISKERIAFAMQGFLSCLNTTDFQKLNSEQAPKMNTFVMSGVRFSVSTNLTPLEQQGLFLFHAKYNCAQCHVPSGTSNNPPGGGGYGGVSGGGMSAFVGQGPQQFIDQTTNSFVDANLFNIGLDEATIDKGLGGVTGLKGDAGLFKVPTLHNISVTAPYMHDGRFATLDEVLDHYSHNIKNNPNLTPVFKNTDGTPKTLNISAAEKTALIAFLNTLRDDDFLTSPMYSDPFK